MFAASAAFAAALMIQGLIILNNSSYEPTRWQTMLLYWAILLYGALINIFGEFILPTANLIAGMSLGLFSPPFHYGTEC